MNSLISCIVVFALSLCEVNSYCIYNQTPGPIVLRTKFSLNKYLQIQSSTSQCCDWRAKNCFQWGGFSGVSRSSFGTVSLLCSIKQRNRDVRIQLPRDGTLVVRQSVRGQENYVEVFDISNKMVGSIFCNERKAPIIQQSMPTGSPVGSVMASSIVDSVTKERVDEIDDAKEWEEEVQENNDGLDFTIDDSEDINTDSGTEDSNTDSGTEDNNEKHPVEGKNQE
jgi:hypothetical protein